MNKQEAIEKIKNLKGLTILNKTINFDSEMVSKEKVLNIIKQLDELVKPPEPEPWKPEKPVVPQFVADWYEENKYDFEYNLNLYMLCIDFSKRKLRTDLHRWFGESVNKPFETLVKMKLYGYEVEKEKLYTVELPNPNAGGHVVLCKTGDGRVAITFTSAGRWRGGENAQLTEAEIKQDFEWVWQFAKEVEE